MILQCFTCTSPIQSYSRHFKTVPSFSTTHFSIVGLIQGPPETMQPKQFLRRSLQHPIMAQTKNLSTLNNHVNTFKKAFVDSRNMSQVDLTMSICPPALRCLCWTCQISLTGWLQPSRLCLATPSRSPSRSRCPNVIFAAQNVGKVERFLQNLRNGCWSSSYLFEDPMVLPGSRKPWAKMNVLPILPTKQQSPVAWRTSHVLSQGVYQHNRGVVGSARMERLIVGLEVRVFLVWTWCLLEEFHVLRLCQVLGSTGSWPQKIIKPDLGQTFGDMCPQTIQGYPSML